MTSPTAAAGTVRRARARAADSAELPGAARVRRALALLFAAYAVILTVTAVSHGDFPSAVSMLILMGAAALWANRGGAFLRDWVPVLLGLLAYAGAGQFASKLDFRVHYLPQIDMDRLIGFGHLPTVELQHVFYRGGTGALEVCAAVMYVSHFFMPIVFGFYVWWRGRKDAFTELMFGLLAVSVLAEITFVLAPTAPPWMAADHGLIPPVHHVFKQTLADLHLGQASAFVGNPKSYNTVAAMPSLHAAWPVVCMLVARRYKLPRWVLAALALQFTGVLFSIVYMGDHYVSDAVIGAIYALAAGWLVSALRGCTAWFDKRGWRRPGPRTVLAAQDGQAVFEYALILSLVSIAAVTLLQLIGADTLGLLASVATGF
jgi:Flp pilus assembly pilin Flp